MNFNSKLAKIAQGAFIVGLLVMTTYYINANFDSLKDLLNIDLKPFSVMLIFTVISIYAGAAQNAVLFRALGAPVGNIESFGLSNVGALLSLFVPQGATLTKAVYLKQRYGMPYSKAPALFLGLFVIFLLVGAAIMLVTNIGATLMGISVPLILWIGTFVGCASGFIFLIDIPKESLSRFGKVGGILSNFLDGWRLLRTNRSCLVKAAFWQVLIFISSGVWVSVAYQSLGININLLLGVSLSVFMAFANLVVIVPGNLGVQEAFYGYFSFLFGMLFSQGIVVSALIRSVGLLTTLMLSPVSWYLLFYRRGIRLDKGTWAKAQDA